MPFLFTEPRTAGFGWIGLVMVSRLTVRGDVQTFALFVFSHTQAEEHVDNLVGDEGDNT